MDSKMITLVIELIFISLIAIFVRDLVPCMKAKVENKRNKLSRLNRKLGKINFQMRTEDNSGNSSYRKLKKKKDKIEEEIENLGQGGERDAQEVVQ